MNTSFKERLLLSTVMTGIAASMAVVTAPVASAQDAEVDEIFVTGSRIARKDFTANSPVITVGQEELNLSGVTNIENLLNQLPAVVPGLSSTSNNPGLGGQATVDLRGLGPARTLVLINGRRLAPSDKSGTVDLNVIPATLVERIEVVTGGASAVYGSDALAGVVNFIMKDDFEGIEYGMSYGQSDQEDAAERTYDVTLGGNFGNGRGNAVVYGQWFKRDGVLQGERWFSEHAGVGIGGPGAWGSSRTPPSSLENSILNPFPSGGRQWIANDGNSIGTAANTYDFAPVNALILPQERMSLSGMATYEINDYVTAFTDFIYADIQANVQLAPAPLTPSTGIRVPWDNPFLNDLIGIHPSDPLGLDPGVPGAGALIAARPTDPTASIAIQRRMLEIGNRLQFHDKKFYQATTGLKGTMPEWPLFSGWDWEASYSRSSSVEYDRLENDLSITRVQESLDGCLPGSSSGCMILDFFSENSISTAGADWLRLKSVIDKHSYDQETLAGFISGDVWELPAGPLQVALGAEYRKDEIGFLPADASRGDLIGFNAVQPTAGDTDVKEGYIEAVIPILADYEMAQYLGIEAGFRYSKYSSVGGVRSFKVGAEWQPVEDVRFRVMYQEATRAPSVFELFQAGDQNFPGYSDPCNSPLLEVPPEPALSGVTAQICAWQLGLASDPVTPAAQAILDIFSQSDTQVGTLNFGNPDLMEESSETLTVGAVITPTFLPWGDLTVAIDYYDIEVTDWIGLRGSGTIIGSCYGSATLAAAQANSDCAAISRNAAGDMFDIINPQENAGLLATTGVDINAVYSFSMEEFGISEIPGDFQISALATYLDSWEFDGTEYKGIGYGLGVAYPEWKSTVRGTYSLNDWQVSWQWERIGEICDLVCTWGYTPIESKSYNNVSARWFATENFEVTGNVDNLFDEQPQTSLHGYFSGPNVDASTYDIVGRYYRIGARLKF